MTAPLATRYTELMGITHPVLQDGMGPFRTTRLAAAVSSAGGLGTLSSPTVVVDPVEGARTLRACIDECASLTTAPFTVNIPIDTHGSAPFTAAYLTAVIAARDSDSALARQIRAVTTSAGSPEAHRATIADAGLLHAHKVGSTRQALKAQALGVDIVIASGAEMGGHTHARPVHTFVLGPSVTEALDVPVVLSGGVRDGRSLAAALCMGADAVGLGTRFIASDSNGEWHPNYARAIVGAAEGDDVTYPGFFGPVRGLRNKGCETLHALVAGDTLSPEELYLWKLEAMKLAQAGGDVDNGLVLAGQVSGAITDIVSVAEFVPAIAEEAARILTALGRRFAATSSTA